MKKQGWYLWRKHGLNQFFWAGYKEINQIRQEDGQFLNRLSYKWIVLNTYYAAKGATIYREQIIESR